MSNLSEQEIRGKASTLIVTCGNCYNEKEVGLTTIGMDIKQFYNEHRTRIGKTFCSIEALTIRYDPFTKCGNQREVAGRIDENENWARHIGPKWDGEVINHEDIHKRLGELKAQQGEQDG